MDRGELPGYEFEVPRGPRYAGGPRHPFGHDSLRYIQNPRPPEPVVKSPVRVAGSGVFDIMRKRNWVMGLAVPILAAIVVGVAVVVAAGGGGTGGAAPSALAAGFPPARSAGAAFTENTATPRVTLAAIGASGATEVTAGGLNGGPALWSSPDGGTDWARAVLRGTASATGPGTGQFTGVADGPAGWLAVGTTLAAGGKPLVASSADTRTWTVESDATGLVKGTAMAVAAGTAGYVIVGHQSAGGPGMTAAAWYAPGLAGWRAAAIPAAGRDPQTMNAVTAAAHGFIAVGATGTSPAAWLSATGQTWQQVRVPVPAGTVRAALDYVAANGSAVVAAGTEFSATGLSLPFVEASADAGTRWAQVQLPVPDTGTGTGTDTGTTTGSTVTALTAAGGGFTAVGTYVTQAGPEVVIWTLPSGANVTDGAGWAVVAPQGCGLASPKGENVITALTADGATLTGAGFTTEHTSSCGQGPTLWQSPIRY